MKILQFVALGIAVAQAPCLRAESLLIRNVHIHPVTSAEIEKGSVLIVDGKIAAVGRDVSGRGARVIEGKGLHLYPGLINAATSVGLQEIASLKDSVDLSEMGRFNPQLEAQYAFNPTSVHVGVVRAAGITSVLSLPMSGAGRGSGADRSIFGGQGALMHLDGWTWEQMLLKPGVVLDMDFPEVESRPARFAALLGDPPRPFTELEKEYKQKLTGISEFIEESRRYQKAKAAAEPSFRPDPKLEAMIPVLEGARPILVRAERARAIRDAVALADKEHVKIIIAGPMEIGDTGPLLKQHNIPVILRETLELPIHDDDAYDARYTLPSEFYKAGVKLCFGTFDVQFARNVAFQAAAAAAFGLPQEEALKAVTINSAEILGAGTQIGSIEKGKVADLILTDGDPLEAKTSIRAEFIAGKEVGLENRQFELYKKFLSRN